MNRLKSWLANQYWEWDDLVIWTLGAVLVMICTVLAAVVVSLTLYGDHGTLQHFGFSWLVGNGTALTLWGLAWCVLHLPEWARRAPAKPDEKPQGVVDWLKEQALRELDEQFPADKETK